MTKHATPSPSGSGLHSLVGQRVDERFEITALIEANAHSAIYLATQQPLDRVVALKVIELKHLKGKDSVAQLLEEAKLLSAMTHPNLVRVHDFGQDKTHKIVFLAMEYVQGVSLRELLSQDHRLDVALSLELAHQLLGALIELHTQELAHLNLNPKDILIVPMSDGSPQLRLVGLGGLNKHEHTQPEPAYRAPEQLQHLRAGAGADLYTVGLLLYEMLCGYNPFNAPSYSEIVNKQLNTPATPLSDLLSDDALPDGVELVVMKLLAKDLQWRLAPALNARQRIEELQDQHRLPRVRLSTQEDELLARFARWRKPTNDAARSALSLPVDVKAAPAPKPSKTRRHTPLFVSAEAIKPATPPEQPTPQEQPEIQALAKEANPKSTLMFHSVSVTETRETVETPLAIEPSPTPTQPQEVADEVEQEVEPETNELTTSPQASELADDNPLTTAPTPEVELKATPEPEPQATKAEEAPEPPPKPTRTRPPEQEAKPKVKPKPKLESEPKPKPKPEPVEVAPEPVPVPQAKVIITAQEPEPAKTAHTQDEDAFFGAPVEPAFDAEHIFVDEDYKEKSSKSVLIPVSIVLVLLVGGAIATLVMSDLGKAQPEEKRDDRGWSATPTAKLSKPSPSAQPPVTTPAGASEELPPAPPQEEVPALTPEEQIKALAPPADEPAQPEAPAAPAPKEQAASPQADAPSPKSPIKQPAAAPAAKAMPSAAAQSSPEPAVTSAKVAPEAAPKDSEEDTNKSPTIKKVTKKKLDPVDKKLKKNLDWLKRR